MARPQKEGLDYFPLDVDVDQDDKVALIEAQHGVTGFAIVVKLLMKVYKNSYFYNWTEKEQLLFSRGINVDINTLQDVVNDCIKWELFSKKMYDNHQVLTSKGIQLRYLEATSRRQEVKILQEYLLICKPKVNEYKNLVVEVVNVDINPTQEVVNVDINPQSKVKESKVKEKDIYAGKTQFLDTVYLTEKEYERLIADYGKQLVDSTIEDLDEWQTNNPKKQKTDHNKTLRKWMKDKKKQNPIHEVKTERLKVFDPASLMED
jgi:hypothetical protein